MRIRIFLALIITAGMVLLVLSMTPGTALADDGDKDQLLDELQKGVDSKISELDLSEIQKIIDGLPAEVKKLTGQSASGFLEGIVTGKIVLDAGSFLDVIGNIFFSELKNNGLFFLQIMLLVILGGILKNMSPSLGKDSVSEIAQFACYALVAALIATSFSAITTGALKTIDSMNTLLKASFPVLLTLLTALGGVYSAGVFQPVMPFMTAVSGTFLKDILLPLILIFAVLTLISNFSNRIQIKKLAGLAGSAGKWLIGIVSTVFLGVMSIQGISAGAFDGLSIRTAKYAIDKFVPVVGRMVSDTMDTMMSCSLLVKNAFGMVTLVVLCGIVLIPLVNLMVMIFMYKASAAVLEPMGDSRIVQCLHDMSEVITMLFVIVLVLGTMMFIAVSLLISTGNASMMMR